uniref:Ig-like domain-containing protein n=1 Tax=Astyanax mexicanus TaxID=7994 RepID=A0A8B9J6A5_ASTMX
MTIFISFFITVLLFLLLFLPAGNSAVTTFTGYSGKSVQINCPYQSGFETNMYLCRGQCLPWETKDIPVESGSTAKDQRFSLKDDTAARVFTVTITDLRPEDAGQYWCVVKRSYRVSPDYTEIQLLVKTDAPKPLVFNSTLTPVSVQIQSTHLPLLASTGIVY